MITRIEVDGFKSLTDFSLDFHPGLNIMVGPNGAGKTNIIQFLEFLSFLGHGNIDDIFDEFGGAGVVFKKKGTDDYVNNINGCVTGKLNENVTASYEYSFTITRNGLFFSSQDLKIKFGQSIDWDIHLHSESADGKESSPRINILQGEDFADPRFLKGNQYHYKHSLIVFSSMLASDDLNYIMKFITYDFSANHNFYVIPDKVRELEDSSSSGGIKKDGSGLARTLYAFDRKDGSIEFGENGEYSKDMFVRIKRHLQNANSSIDDLTVEKNNFDNKLLVKIFIKSGDYNAVLPLSSMSDGTLKWLTLLTAIYTTGSGFSIEEPENYLHPWMQSEIVSIIRSKMEGENTFALLTTHSETLINTVKPEEIILVDFKSGKTLANRLDADLVTSVKEAISNSGLGLGHFYFSNALSDAQ